MNIADLNLHDLAVTAYGEWLSLPKADREHIASIYPHALAICHMTTDNEVTPTEKTRYRLVAFAGAVRYAK